MIKIKYRNNNEELLIYPNETIGHVLEDTFDIRYELALNSPNKYNKRFMFSHEGAPYDLDTLLRDYKKTNKHRKILSSDYDVLVEVMNWPYYISNSINNGCYMASVELLEKVSNRTKNKLLSMPRGIHLSNKGKWKFAKWTYIVTEPVEEIFSFDEEDYGSEVSGIPLGLVNSIYGNSVLIVAQYTPELSNEVVSEDVCIQHPFEKETIIKITDNYEYWFKALKVFGCKIVSADINYNMYNDYEFIKIFLVKC